MADFAEAREERANVRAASEAAGKTAQAGAERVAALDRLAEERAAAAAPPAKPTPAFEDSLFAKRFARPIEPADAVAPAHEQQQQKQQHSVERQGRRGAGGGI